MLSASCHGFLALLCHADQIQLTLVLLACFLPFGIVQAVHCGAPYAAACSLANSVQPLLTLIIVEPTHLILGVDRALPGCLHLWCKSCGCLLLPQDLCHTLRFGVAFRQCSLTGSFLQEMSTNYGDDQC